MSDTPQQNAAEEIAFSGKLVTAGTMSVGDDLDVTGVFIQLTVDELRAIKRLPMYRRVTVTTYDHAALTKDLSPVEIRKKIQATCLVAKADGAYLRESLCESIIAEAFAALTKERDALREELRRCMDLFHEMGIPCVPAENILNLQPAQPKTENP